MREKKKASLSNEGCRRSTLRVVPIGDPDLSRTRSTRRAEKRSAKGGRYNGGTNPTLSEMPRE